MNKRAALCIAFIACTAMAHGQDDMANMPGMAHGRDTAKSKKKEAMPGMDMAGMKQDKDMGMSAMSSALSPNLPMGRDGSGTAWLPDASPVYGYMAHAGKWMFMFHGDVFIRYNSQDITNEGRRGSSKWDAPDMLMAMGQRKMGNKGLFHFNAMFSADALIAGGSGYPLLFQTGESWQGQPLVDRQHPHDLFSELSVSYAYAFSPKSDLSLYLGYPGEPALGPVTFMHRPSGGFMPDAPLGHHWADATHITFGVATLGLRFGKFKLEGSSFTGREPDENRYNFDKPLFDSRCGRLSFNPSANWALQVSHGYIQSPEALRPTENVNRTTASATYVSRIAENKYFTGTLLWGQNEVAGQPQSNAALIEAMLKMRRLAVYTRYEWVQKSAEELDLNSSAYGIATLYPVNAATIGAGYDLLKAGPVTVAGGAQASLYPVANTLTSLYGQSPLAAEIYLHIYPSMMK